MPPRSLFHRLVLGVCALLCTGGAGAFEPFAYPSGLLDAPATLTEPPADFLRIGKPQIVLGETPLSEAARFTGASRLREGGGVFARDYMCLTGTENGRTVVAWVIASGSRTVSEAQLEWLDKGATAPGYCRAVPPEQLPFRLGKIGLGMSRQFVTEVMGRPSHTDKAGWTYWFSQRWLRNDRNLQELELNWLAVEFEKNQVKRAFISLVKNP